MTEKTPTESVMLDQENAKLTAKLFDPIAIKDLLQKFALVPGFELKSGDDRYRVIGMPATGELSFYEIKLSEDLRQRNKTKHILKFREDGTIVLIDPGSNFRTKYVASSREVVRYNSEHTSLPDQFLPRHAKNNFLKLAIEAQDQIEDLLERLEVSTSEWVSYSTINLWRNI